MLPRSREDDWYRNWRRSSLFSGVMSHRKVVIPDFRGPSPRRSTMALNHTAPKVPSPGLPLVMHRLDVPPPSITRPPPISSSASMLLTANPLDPRVHKGMPNQGMHQSLRLPTVHYNQASTANVRPDRNITANDLRTVPSSSMSSSRSPVSINPTETLIIIPDPDLILSFAMSDPAKKEKCNRFLDLIEVYADHGLIEYLKEHLCDQMIQPRNPNKYMICCMNAKRAAIQGSRVVFLSVAISTGTPAAVNFTNNGIELRSPYDLLRELKK
ncbi:hypothetical protein Ddc_02061 [Ditylenchus destructor]|nr:hypothetical protein Ddc_02061 [Ditylenchus destructor]